MFEKKLQKMSSKGKLDKLWNDMMTGTWAGDLIHDKDDGDNEDVGIDIPTQNGVNLVGVHCLHCFELTKNFLQAAIYAHRLKVDKNLIIECEMCDLKFYIEKSWSNGVTSIDYYDLDNNLIYEGGY